MAAGTNVELAVRRWAAWAPGLPDRQSWQRWARGEQAIGGTARPDVSSVGKLQRRRLSDVTRMAFSVVEQCLENEPDDDRHQTRFVYCSRYGEYPRSFEILWDLVRKEPVSPTAFSTSVHNTAASQFAIHRRDHSQFTVLTAGETSLENAFVEAWTQINNGDCASVMIVYHDQPLPDIYRNQATSVAGSLALALLLSQPSSNQDDRVLRLTWQPSRLGPGEVGEDVDTVLPIIRLLLVGGAPIVQDTGRLVWSWTETDAHH